MYFIIDCDQTRAAFRSSLTAFGIESEEYTTGNSVYVDVNIEGFNDSVCDVLRNLLRDLKQLRMENHRKYLRDRH